MQLNQATDYSFRVILHLTLKDTIVSAKELAEQEQVPMRFLLKILGSLVKAGILKSYRGQEGGYALAKDPKDITLLDVIEAMEGPIAINRCLTHQDYCSKRWTKVCPVHNVLGNIQKELVDDLSKHNFQDLINSYRSCQNE
ncbi:Transcription regulator Rrf2-like [Syntrophomonas zehnderi OL-4]|uniref:Transcription regulator Rrf2-like n=1 Tax=Syntrophomonas zehnderi OL-4 TaxID=690567 RepID=A0A0E3W2H8_9FIRM|nr:Rrf2 family transcriptional regulator [Syntrophomonas zehnderi]CFX01156.1 Transcription regulator Rrf2-like [Syntrophomonas zehnderi OL-4]